MMLRRLRDAPIVARLRAAGAVLIGGTVSRADWGAMIYEYRVFLFERPELIAWPAAALSLTCLFVNLVADQMFQDILRLIA